MAYFDVVFAAGADIAGGRAEIAARVAAARSRLPATARILVGPEASSTGWVYQYALVAPSLAHTMGARIDPFSALSLLRLRRFQDEVLRPALAGIPDVAEVASVGGEVEELLIEARPDKLREAGVAFSDVVAGAHAGLRPASGGTVEETAHRLEAAPLGATGGGATAPSSGPTRLGDVARVRVAAGMASGMADFGGFVPTVGGIVIARRGADVSALIAAVKRVLERARAQLPAGTELVPVYDRSDLADRVGRGLARALAEEIAVLVVVVLLFLLHPRSALVPLATLPLVLLLTFAAMWLCGVPATMMSLGGIAIALGLAVDADVVALEACHRRLETLEQGSSAAERRRAITAAASAFAPAIVTSLVIAALTFVPVFGFGGETGRLLRPLAFTKTLVIAAAAVVAIAVAPALRARLLTGRIVPEFSNPLTRILVRAYRPFVHFALARPTFTLVTAALAVISCVPIVGRLGGEFLPRIDEGDLFFMPTTTPGVPPEQAGMQLARQDWGIRGFAEVATVFGKVGRADTATDPAPFSMAETTIRLKPRGEWPKIARRRWYSGWAPAPVKGALRLLWPDETPASKAELVEALDRASRLRGWNNAWTAPARARMDMTSTGVRTPVGIRIVAPDASRLDALGAAVREVALRVPGTRSATYESLGGETRLAFVTDAAALARHRADAAEVEATAQIILTGGQIAQLPPRTAGGPPIAVRVLAAPIPTRNEDVRRPDELLREATVRVGAQAVPLALLGRPTHVNVPASLRVERGEPTAYVHIDLQDGVDLLGYVERARAEVARATSAGQIALAPGERTEWTGQYELLAAGQRRLKVIAPIVVLSMLLLLFLQFRSFTEAAIVLVSVPFALVGSFWTLFLLDYRLSAPVWVGLLSVVGLAMQTGVVMVVYIDEAFHRRLREGRVRDRDDIVAAHAEGTVQRLRPKIMTISTMAAGLLPLLWSDGAGSEIMRRVAAPMIGGLVTSAFLTLEVIPVLYTIWRHRQLRRAQRTGTPLAVLVGRPPSWARGRPPRPDTMADPG
jgi:Cu(I)/Ag(I) efflux system membrane protein CusA/SilA